MNISGLIYGVWGLVAYMNATLTSSTPQHNQLSGDQAIIDTVSGNTSAAVNDPAIAALEGIIEAYSGAISILHGLTSQTGNFDWIDSSFECQETYLEAVSFECIFRGGDDTFADDQSGHDLKKVSETFAGRFMRIKYYLGRALLFTHPFNQSLKQFMQLTGRACPEPMSLDNSTRLSDHEIEGGLRYIDKVWHYMSWTMSDVLLIAGASAESETLIRGLETELDSAPRDLKTRFEVVVAGWTSDHAGVKAIRHVADIRNHARHDMSTIRGIISPEVETYLEQHTALIHDFRYKVLCLIKAWPSTERQQEATKMMCHAAEHLGRPDPSKKQDSTLWSKAIGWLNDLAIAG